MSSSHDAKTDPDYLTGEAEAAVDGVDRQQQFYHP
jgi:hypothetical protein